MRMIATAGSAFRWAASGLLAALPVVAGPPPAPPPFYAIENVRVEVGDGTVLERATVVVENGTIVAVAESAAIPAHAWVIDGEGLTVYPGLIDAMGRLPQARRPPGRSGRGRSAGRPAAPAGSRPATASGAGGPSADGSLAAGGRRPDAGRGGGRGLAQGRRHLDRGKARRRVVPGAAFPGAAGRSRPRSGTPGGSARAGPGGLPE